MSNPFFSLITPVYNIEKLLPKTIESALEQTFTDWEMILVDDGSPDSAGKVCDTYAENDSRIRVIHKQNAGLAAARNTGIKEATGKYFLIFEGSDLLFDENTLTFIHQKLVEYPVDVFFGRLQDMMENTGEITGEQDAYCVKGEWNKGGEALVEYLYDHEDILALSSPVNKVFRRQFVLDHGLWFCEGIYHDDDEWIPKAIAHAGTAYFTDQVIYNAMTWDGCFGGNVSEKGLTKKAVDKMFIALRCCNYFEQHFQNNRALREKMNTYYIRMYQDGIRNFYKVNGTDYKTQIMAAAQKYSDVFRYGKVCDSRNLAIFCQIGRMFGVKLARNVLEIRCKNVDKL